jgi:hypothetical protein
MATTNRVQKSSDGVGVTHLMDSTIHDDGANVGIGTTIPSDLLMLDAGSNRRGLTITSDGNANAYSDITQSVKTTSGISTGKPTSWSPSLRKDGYFSGDSSGPTLEFYAEKKGGGFLAPMCFKSNGDVVLAGAQNATNGNTGIGTTSPSEKLQVNGNIRVDDGAGYPGTNRVWTTQKVYNVLDYGAKPLVTICHGAGGSIRISPNSRLDAVATGEFNGVAVGDYLWIHSDKSIPTSGNSNIGCHLITGIDSVNHAYVEVSAFDHADANTVYWMVTTASSTVDNQAAFQRAIDAAAADSSGVGAGGGVVYVPTAYFYFTSSTTLTIRKNVILRGIWSAPPMWKRNFWMRGEMQGPVLLPTASRNDTEQDPFITLEGGDTDSASSSTIEGLSIYYPNQWVYRGAGGSTDVHVQQYPYCIKINSSYNSDNRVMNMLLVNPYFGIQIIGEVVSGKAVGRSHIQNVSGSPLAIGIYIDNIWDVCYIEKIFFNPRFIYLFASTDTTEQNNWNTYLAIHLTAIYVQCAVWMVIQDVFALFADRGLVVQYNGALSGANYANIMGKNIQFDMCDVGIEVVKGEAYLTNVRITCGGDEGSVNNKDVYDTGRCILGDGASGYLTIETGVLCYWNSTLSVSNKYCIEWLLSEGNIRISNVMFIDSTESHVVTAGLYASAGRVQIHNCLFQHNNASYGFSKCIEITSGAALGIVYGNDYRDYSSPVSNAATSTVFDVNGNIEIGTADYFYMGDANTDGSWRFHVSGSNLRFERRISGSWVDKGGFNG